MKYFIASVFLFISTWVSAQKGSFKSTQQLAAFINERYTDSSEKIRQAYKWITTNIRYDATNALAINHGPDKRAVVDVAFTRRKGVCENFAAIFSDLTSLMGFQSVVIEGLARQYSRIDRQGHSWVGVKTGGDWYLFDPTWDAGAGDNFKYFRQSGNSFIATHFPFDPLWQMTDRRVGYEEFANGRKGYDGRIPVDYKDAINRYLALDSLQQITTKIDHMERSGIPHNVAEVFYKMAKSDLEGEKQEQQMQWYNAAATLLNECTDQLNEFVQYRNDRFHPAKPDEVMVQMLKGIDEKISTALDYFDKVDASDAVLVYGTGPVRDQLNKFKITYHQQREFLQRYLATPVADRETVLYQ